VAIPSWSPSARAGIIAASYIPGELHEISESILNKALEIASKEEKSIKCKKLAPEFIPMREKLTKDVNSLLKGFHLEKYGPEEEIALRDFGKMQEKMRTETELLTKKYLSDVKDLVVMECGTSKIDGPANCRDAPDGKTLISIPNNEIVRVGERKSDWIQIHYGSTDCWTHKKNLRFK